MTRPFAIGALLALSFGCTAPGPASAPPRFDVVVYGGTAAGVVAALQAREMGRSVVLLEPGSHLGGLSSGGLGNTDIGNKGAIGGRSRQFYERVAAHYARPEAWKQETRDEYLERSSIGNQGHGREDPVAERTGVETMWVFEPSVAEGIFREMADEAGVDVRSGQRLDLDGGVVKDGRAIRSIRTEGGAVYEGRVFIDATYEGDLMAAGRRVATPSAARRNAEYGETLNGVQTATRRPPPVHARRSIPTSCPGDPRQRAAAGRSRRRPRARRAPGDHRVQAYYFRMCLTDVPENRSPFAEARGLRPAALRAAAAQLRGRATSTSPGHPMPDAQPQDRHEQQRRRSRPTTSARTTTTPTATTPTRRADLRRARAYQQGLMWTLANDPRVPRDGARGTSSRWGLAKDEFAGQRQLAAPALRPRGPAHGRRLRHDRARLPRERGRAEDSVGPGRLQHGLAPRAALRRRRRPRPQRGRRPGGALLGPTRSLPLDRAAARGVRRTCSCRSASRASHIAYGSIRMEPVFMVLGQSAATAAVLALDAGGAVQDVRYESLRDRLLADGQILEWESAPRSSSDR